MSDCGDAGEIQPFYHGRQIIRIAVHVISRRGLAGATVTTIEFQSGDHPTQVNRLIIPAASRAGRPPAKRTPVRAHSGLSRVRRDFRRPSAKRSCETPEMRWPTNGAHCASEVVLYFTVNR